jgi:CO/xanthine dehydrogenase Mo-binding subunit
VIFVIEKDGSVTVESVTQDFGSGFEKKIAQVVASMPKFTPGKVANGQVVRVRYILPIRFEPEQ